MKKDKDKKKKREKRVAEPVLEGKTSSGEAELSGGDEPVSYTHLFREDYNCTQLRRTHPDAAYPGPVQFHYGRGI